MGVLDRLEREARDARARRDSLDAARAHRTAGVTARLGPALGRAQRYLERFADSLNDLDRRVAAEYRIDGLGVLARLEQASYRVTRDGGAEGPVQLRFECDGREPIDTRVDNAAQAEVLARTLRDAGLACRVDPVGKRTTRVRVDAKVPVRIILAADTDRAVVRLDLHNLRHIGLQRHALQPERIDGALLDALASLVLREPGRFDELTGYVLEQHQRDDLKRTVARDQRRRDAELAGGFTRLAFPVREWFRRLFLDG